MVVPTRNYYIFVWVYCGIGVLTILGKYLLI
jgi:hypothetical protein